MADATDAPASGLPYDRQIPFSDFLMTHRGVVQRSQLLFNARRVRTIGLLLADKCEGPFQLDIVSISAVRTTASLLPQRPTVGPPLPDAPIAR